MARGRPSHKTQESCANAKVTHEIQLTKHSNLRSIYKNTGVLFFLQDVVNTELNLLWQQCPGWKKKKQYIYGTFKKKTCTLLLPIHWTQLPFSQLNQKRMTPSPGLNKVLSREGHAGTASMWCTNSRAACARVPTGEVAVDMQEPVADEGYDIPP